MKLFLPLQRTYQRHSSGTIALCHFAGIGPPDRRCTCQHLSHRKQCGTCRQGSGSRMPCTSRHPSRSGTYQQDSACSFAHLLKAGICLCRKQRSQLCWQSSCTDPSGTTCMRLADHRRSPNGKVRQHTNSRSSCTKLVQSLRGICQPRSLCKQCSARCRCDTCRRRRRSSCANPQRA